jgi:hypothetical protein
MEGIFHNSADETNRYGPYNKDGDNMYYRRVTLERDIGPYVKGEEITNASWNMCSGEVTLSNTDYDGYFITSHKIKIRVRFNVAE